MLMFSVEENGKINIPKSFLSAYRDLQIVILRGEPGKLKEIRRFFEEIKKIKNKKIRNLNYFLSTV